MRPFHPLFIFEVLPQLVPYLLVTAGIVIGTVFFGGLLGLVLAAAKIRRGNRSCEYLYLCYTLCPLHCTFVHCILWAAGVPAYVWY